MHELPHVYKVDALALSAGHVFLSAAGKPDIESMPPAEFGGPGNAWSPEELVVAAVSDCFILSFRAIATASRFEWISLECHAEGTLDQVDGSYRFTGFRTLADLKIATPDKEDHARRLMEKADKMCLVTNSLIAPCTLQAKVTIESSVGG